VKPNGTNWRHGRARLDLSAEEAAERLRISPQYLRNIESNQPKSTPSDRLVYRAAALYRVMFEDLVIVDGDEDTQTKPSEEPQREEREPDPPRPPARRDDHKGPPRSTLKAAS
jgi:transcriptional regulator with XRE-family HTH domain